MKVDERDLLAKDLAYWREVALAEQMNRRKLQKELKSLQEKCEHWTCPTCHGKLNDGK